MKKGFKLCFLLMLTLGIQPARAETSADEQNAAGMPGVTVRAYDYAKLSSRIRMQTASVAGSILRKAGIRLVWLDCPMEASAESTVCDGPLGPTDLVFRFLQRGANTPAVFRRSHCGFATRDDSGRGAFASVFVDCLKDLPAAGPLSAGVILGHLVAHELGHLLLPSERHYPSGLMRANLRQAEWKQAAIGALVFTREQGASIQAEIQAREREGNPPEITGATRLK